MNTNKVFKILLTLVFTFSILEMPPSVLAQEPIPNPVIAVYPLDRQIFGWSWTPQTTIQVSAEDCFSTTTSDLSGNFFIQFEDSCHLQGGDTITTTDGILTKDYVIADLIVTSADADSNTVYGTAKPGSNIQAWVCEENNCVNRHEIPDELGNWSANFFVPGDEPTEQNTFDLQPGSQGDIVLHETDGNATSVRWHVPNPIIWGVTASNNWISGQDWQRNGSIEISIDNPSTPENPDSTTIQITDGSGNFSYQSQYDITVGSVVTVADSKTIKQVLISSFEVMTIDTTADTISGIGTPNANGAVWGAGWWEPFVVDPTGHWQIILAGRWDIQPQDQGFAIEQDNDGDGTQFNWRLPTLMAQLVENQVRSYGWRLGASVALAIDDSAIPGSPDYTASKIAVPASWDPSQTDILFELGEAFMLGPGMTVMLTDGYITKSHTITGIVITDIDLEADVISGMAQPEANISVGYICDGIGTCAIRRIIANGDGSWSADFSIVGQESDEQTLFDISPGTSSWAGEQDEDGDGTSMLWRVPYFEASIDRPGHSVTGYGWTDGSSISLTIDNPGNGTGVDYTDIQVSELNEWGEDQVQFDLDEFRLETGAAVTLTDGVTSQTLNVAFLDITNVDTDNDRIYGKTDPGSTVEVESPHHARRVVVADPSGNWMADFSIVGPGDNEQDLDDIQEGMGFTTRIYTEGRNSTRLYWRVPDYKVIAYPEEEVIAATEFWPGSAVTITVDDPDNGVGIDLTRTGIIDTKTGGWNCQTWWGFCYVLDLQEEFDVQAGQIITITDGIHTSTHVVTPLAITHVDFAASTVSGSAVSFSEINLDLWPSCGQRLVTADASGNWSEDFSIPGDEDFEQETCAFNIDELRDIIAYQEDGDGETWVGWYVPTPGFEVVLGSNNINGWDWVMDATVTIEVDDPSTPLNPDYLGSAVVGPASWDPARPFFEMMTTGYDLKPGDHVTVTDGIRTKTTIVAEITTNFDVISDIISGITAPTVEIHVISDDGPERFTYSDSSGNWSVNYSVEQDGQPVLNLVYGSAGVVAAIDDDGDRTYKGWEIPVPQCQTGNTVTGTIFEHNGVTPIGFANIQIEDYSTGEVRFVTNADSNGTFACFLPNGEYRILASTEGNTHTQEYYNEATDANATSIHVTNGVQFTNVNFTITPTPAIEHFTFNLDNPLLQDLAVRQAIALGTDREQILYEAFLPNGIYGMISNSIVPPEHWASAPASELTLHPFDPVEARTILEAAGWIDRDSDGYRENVVGDELSFVFKTNDAPSRIASAEIFRQSMEEIGIRITVNFAPISEIVSSHDFDIVEFAWIGCIDNEPCLGEYVSNSQYNSAHYDNPAYDAAITNARTAIGDVAKLPHLIEAQSILAYDLPILSLFTRYEVSPVITPVGSNISVSPNAYLTIHFADVTQEGVTTVLPTNIAPVNLPPNFQLLGQVYDIGTSAHFTSAQVCFMYDDAGLSPTQEASIQLFHLEENTWVDVTDAGYADTNNNIVCGTVSDFSPFVILYQPEQSPFISFVVLGQEGIWIKEDSDIVSGDVGANISTNGPYLTDQSEVTIGTHVRFLNPESRVLGDTIYLKQGSQTYDVYYNEIRGQGLVLGNHYTPLDLPLVFQMPTVPEAAPGTQNFDLKKNAALTLDAGNYGKLETKKNATITFTGGVYHFTEWLLGDNVTVYFTAPTEIRIAGKLDIGSDAYLGPVADSDVTAHDIFIYVLGENGKNGKMGATPKAAKFGTKNTLFAIVYAPNGTLWIRERSTITGAFFGKWVMIGENVTLTLDSGWH